MLTMAMKLISIGALTLALLFPDLVSTIELPLRFIVSLSAFLVARQAVQAGKRAWAMGFCLLVFLFNPLLTVLVISGRPSLIIVLCAVIAFGISSIALPHQPLKSIPSITDRTPGSVSL
jgi:hypothetical protein